MTPFARPTEPVNDCQQPTNVRQRPTNDRQRIEGCASRQGEPSPSEPAPAPSCEPGQQRDSSGSAQQGAEQTPGESWAPAQVLRCQQWLGEPICRRLGIFALPPSFVLSVIVPIFNEVQTIDELIGRLRATGIPMQIILVDDGSGDGTAGRVAAYGDQPDITLLTHSKNRGKGAAIRTALKAATGDIIVIQDADREYDPEDFRYLMQPILEGRADVVYGTRYGHADRQVSPLWHELVNALITKLANLAMGIRLSDVETCYKMARRDVWASIENELRENRFGIEIEVTARWARRRMRFFERPIRYQHRWYAEGKKIGWRDGVAALACIVRYGWLRR